MTPTDEEKLEEFKQSSRVLDLRDNPFADPFTYEQQKEFLEELTKKLKSSKVIESTIYTTKTHGSKLVSDLMVSIGIAYIVNLLYWTYTGVKNANVFPLNYVLGSPSAETGVAKQIPSFDLVSIVDRMLPSLVSRLQTGQRSEEELNQKLFAELKKQSKFYIETLPPDRKKAIEEIDKQIESMLEATSNDVRVGVNSISGLLNQRNKLLCIPSRRLDIGHLKKYGNPETRAEIKKIFKEDVVDKYPDKMQGRIEQMPKKMGFAATQNDATRNQYVMVGAPGTGKSLLPKLMQKAYLKAGIVVPVVYIDLKELLKKEDGTYGSPNLFQVFLQKFIEEYGKAQYKNAIFVIEEGAQLLTKKNPNLDQMKDFLDLEKKEIVFSGLGGPFQEKYVIKDFDSATLYFTGNEKLTEIDPTVLDHRVVGMETTPLEREKRVKVLNEAQAAQVAEAEEYDISDAGVEKIKQIVEECNGYLLDVDEKTYEGVRVLKRAGRELVQNLLVDAVEDEESLSLDKAKEYVDTLYARARKEGWETDKQEGKKQGPGLFGGLDEFDTFGGGMGGDFSSAIDEKMKPANTAKDGILVGADIVKAANSGNDEDDVKDQIQDIVTQHPVINLNLNAVRPDRQKTVLEAVTANESICTNFTLMARGVRKEDNLLEGGAEVSDVLACLRAMDTKEHIESLSVDLSDREIDDEVAKDLAALTKLTAVFANQNNITRVGAEALIKSESLQVIQLDLNKISKEESIQLEESSPKILTDFPRHFDVEIKVDMAQATIIQMDDEEHEPITTKLDSLMTSPPMITEDTPLPEFQESHDLSQTGENDSFVALGICAKEEAEMSETSLPLPAKSRNMFARPLGGSSSSKEDIYTEVERNNLRKKYSSPPPSHETRAGAHFGKLLGVREGSGDLLCEVTVPVKAGSLSNKTHIQIVSRELYHGPSLTNEHIGHFLDEANFGKIGVAPKKQSKDRVSSDTLRKDVASETKRGAGTTKL